MRINVVALVYLVIGVLVAVARDYFDNLENIKGIISALLAVLLWPLVLLGIEMHIR
jgi:drug/metabolite transporter (DMT)-like permease